MVRRPSKPSGFAELSPVTSVAAWPVPSSGAEKVAELIVVIFSSFSEPETPVNQA